MSEQITTAAELDALPVGTILARLHWPVGVPRRAAAGGVVVMSPVRIQMTRHRPWRAEHPDAVIVARPSKWGNPISIADVGAAYPSVDTTGIARMVVRDFAVLACRGELSFPNWRFLGGRRGPVTFTYPALAEIRAELAGRDLACWCALDQPCHADVLLALANGDLS